MASSDGVIRLHEAPSQRLLKVLVGHTFFPHVLEFSPDGQWLASASNDRTVRVWRVATGAIVLLLPMRAPRTLAWSADSRLVAAGGYDGKMVAWELSGAQVAAWDAEAGVLSFAPDGKHLAALHGDRTLRLGPGRGGPRL